MMRRRAFQSREAVHAGRCHVLRLLVIIGHHLIIAKGFHGAIGSILRLGKHIRRCIRAVQVDDSRRLIVVPQSRLRQSPHLTSRELLRISRLMARMVLEYDCWRPNAFHANLAAFAADVLVEVASDLASTTSFTDW